MITLTKKLKIQGDNPPFNYSVQADSCASITTNSPTTEVIEITASFANESCINKPMTIIGYDNNNCQFTQSISFTNVCDNLSVLPITKNGNTYSVIASNANCTSLTFDWEYDANVFSVTNQTNLSNTSSITLVNSGQYTPNATIKVTVTDCRGCSKQEMIDVTLCQPVVQNFTVTLAAVPGSFTNTSGEITIPSPTICDSAINWATLVINNTSVPGSFNFTSLYTAQNLGNGKIKITAVGAIDQVLNVLNVLTYTVKDYSGRISNTGIITLLEAEDNNLFVFSYEATVPVSLTPGQTHNINLQTPIGDPDYSTMEILASPEYQSSSITFNSTTKQFVYTKTVGFTVDAFSYRLKNQLGNYSNIGTITVNVPSAVFTVTDRVICLPCGVTNNYPTAASGGTVNSVEILSTENGIIATVLPNNNVQISVPTTAYNGTASTITIRAIDVYGNSDEGTITVNSVCAGSNTGSVFEVCDPIVNPFTDLGVADTSGVWSTTTGSPLPASYNSSVTLTPVGAHVYKYTIPPTHACAGVYVATITYNYQASSAIVGDTCADPIYLTSLPTGLGTTSTTNHTTLITCPNSISTNRAVAGWSGTIAADMFFALVIIPSVGFANINITATVSSVAYSSSPLLNPKIAITSNSCDASNLAVNNYQTSRINSTSYIRAVPVSSETIIIQVGAETKGRFDISITVEGI